MNHSLPSLVDFRERFLQGGCLGQFIHSGPSAAIGLGEQVLWRERRDFPSYIEAARRWNPGALDTDEWIQHASAMGADYAVLITRHHDSYCLWDTKTTDFKLHGRDIVAEFTESCRRAGILPGLYYSWGDWTCPAYFGGPERYPEMWERMHERIRDQLAELTTNYGDISFMWFDGSTPYTAEEWRSAERVEEIRANQPHILINSRLGEASAEELQEEHADGGVGAGGSIRYGDYDIGECKLLPGSRPRVWENCDIPTRKLWGYTPGMAWKTAPELAEGILMALGRGANYMLNLAPDAEGRVCHNHRKLMAELGPWLREVRPELQGARLWGGLTYVNRGWLLVKDHTLFCVLRNWNGETELKLTDLAGTPVRATFVGSSKELPVHKDEDGRVVVGEIPVSKPETVFPIVAIEFDQEPASARVIAKRAWKRERDYWGEFADWAEDSGMW